MMGAGHIWEVMVMRHAVFVEQMEYLPLLAGLLLAVVQFAPRNAPQVPQADPAPAPVGPSDHGHDAFVRRGGPLALLFGASFAVIVASASPVLARELVAQIVGMLLPWYAAGWAAYLFAAWVILEPTWRRRLVNILMSVLLLRIFFLAPVPCAYAGSCPS